ncbi:Homeodomain-like DNA binding domain-containing transcription factor [Phycomyces blakesleeanus NRRL 1555(-)]|uniref:Homeodomain-like DNA binding domain-containing transcription factor n=1 Tax=Phycomyces blakesleeanus (strain ATCC 8743b / DSM 1359 / FGSC 10004 / NBRC 33097 / NRRL 1555) TaxID=763407 RepID=A0A167M980_PHYB8|nr:Homeodomain-like DNA binding domain-containing transcription factor [Phycomyces blakesleeanus NRRL 1555(-)]OAD72177.1 Homeodomain-like DNA binding domain-containing transcription factor [Phycomyces blakesleeanus NRRL 1555(-)]|eukprot:XP_018290217.1 Homeodomain-like DNA binding domain-containing transcription factor [Phycomyces blakesleeanus NRRL 1555(-)]
MSDTERTPVLHTKSRKGMKYSDATHSTHIRHLIIEKSKNQLKAPSEIAKELNILHSTMNTIIGRFERTGSVEYKSLGGDFRTIIKDHHKQFILDMIDSNNTITLAELQQELGRGLNPGKELERKKAEPKGIKLWLVFPMTTKDMRVGFDVGRETKDLINLKMISFPPSPFSPVKGAYHIIARNESVADIQHIESNRRIMWNTHGEVQPGGSIYSTQINPNMFMHSKQQHKMLASIFTMYKQSVSDSDNVNNVR